MTAAPRPADLGNFWWRHAQLDPSWRLSRPVYSTYEAVRERSFTTDVLRAQRRYVPGAAATYKELASQVVAPTDVATHVRALQAVEVVSVDRSRRPHTAGLIIPPCRYPASWCSAYVEIEGWLDRIPETKRRVSWHELWVLRKAFEARGGGDDEAWTRYAEGELAKRGDRQQGRPT
jgi:hypothetical protein